MPRQRRRRRRQAATAQSGASAALPNAASAREHRRPASPTSSRSHASSGSDGSTAPAGRSRWLPTLGVAFAFSLGLWLGGLLSVTDTASAVALLGGVVGLGLTGARMLRRWIERRRLLAIRQRRDRQDQLADQEERRQLYSVPANAPDSSRPAG